jgi:hypothetical protein
MGRFSPCRIEQLPAMHKLPVSESSFLNFPCDLSNGATVMIRLSLISLSVLMWLSAPDAGAIIILSTDDFESGYNQPTDYAFWNGSGDMPNDNYALADSPNAVHSAFLNFADHTSGTGNMMVLNASLDAGRFFYQSPNFNAVTGTTYQFSFWGRSALTTDPSPGEILIQVKDDFGDFTISVDTVTLAPNGTDGWSLFTTEWENTTGLNGPFYMRLIGLNTDAVGNDFAIDDVVVAEVPEPAASVALAAVLVLFLCLSRKRRV